MSVEIKDLVLVIAIGLVGLLVGSIFGFFVGAWGASTISYDDGISAGIDYSNCVTEETPLYGTVTDRILDDCWATWVYEE